MNRWETKQLHKTITAVIPKHGIVINLRRSGLRSEFNQELINKLIQEVTQKSTKNIQKTAGLTCFSSGENLWFNNQKEIGHRCPRNNPSCEKKNGLLHLTFSKHLDDLQCLWKNILWADETKVVPFGRCVSHYTRLKTYTAFYIKYNQSDFR